MILFYPLKVLSLFVVGIFYFILSAILRPFNRNLAVRIIQHYLRLVLRVLAIKLNLDIESGSGDTNNCIYVVLNQSSFLDSLVMPLIPVRHIMGIINIEFALYPVLGWMMMMTSFVIIRQLPWQAKNALNHASTYLQSGGNMVISIEGKRSRDGKLNEYKKGPIVMALNNQSTIIPVIIVGARDLLPYRSLIARSGNVTLRFLRPISTVGYNYESRNEIHKQLVDIARNEGLR